MNCSFVNNSADDGGGAIYVEEGNLTIEDSSFVNNFAGDCCGGGAIYFEDGDLIIKNTNFTDNHVEASSYSVCGGAVYAYTDGYGNVTIIDSNFTNNYIKTDSYAYGGAVYVYSGGYGDVLTIDNCNFKNNYIDSSYIEDYSCGGAVYAEDCNCTVVDSVFENNYVNVPDYFGKGGAIASISTDYWNDSSRFYYGYLDLDNCSFVNNSVDVGYGGAVYAIDNNVTTINCSFIDNFASWYGGAISVFSEGNMNTPNITVVDSIFVNNSVDECDGGAIYNDIGQVYVLNSTFINNSAFTDSTIDNGGGAIYVYKEFTAINSTFINNTATLDGGAIFLNFGEMIII